MKNKFLKVSVFSFLIISFILSIGLFLNKAEASCLLHSCTPPGECTTNNGVPSWHPCNSLAGYECWGAYVDNAPQCLDTPFSISPIGITEGGSAALTYPVQSHLYATDSCVGDIGHEESYKDNDIAGPDVVQDKSPQTVGKTLVAGVNGTTYAYKLTEYDLKPAYTTGGGGTCPAHRDVISRSTTKTLTVCPASKPWDATSKTCKSGSINTPYGTLTASITSCTIPNGGNSCSLDLAWTLQNPATTPTKITTSGSDYTVSTSLASPQNGTQTVTVPYTDPSVPTDRTFYLYNNGMELARKVLTATCAAGTNWSGSACYDPTEKKPNLTINEPVTVSGDAVVGTPVIFSATVKNIGNAPVAASNEKSGFFAFVEKFIKKIFE